MRRRLLLVPLLAPLLVAGWVAGLAGPASAHTELVGSTPASGAAAGPVEQVVLTFSDAVQPALSTVVVTGPDGDDRAAGPVAAASGTEVVQVLDAALPAGRYAVAYRVVADDGHPVTGELAFQVTGSPSATAASAAATAASPPSSAAAPPAPSDPPVIPLAAGALLVAGAGALVVRRRAARP